MKSKFRASSAGTAVVLLAVAALLAGCITMLSTGKNRDWALLVHGQDVPVAIFGIPTGGDRSQFIASVIAAMNAEARSLRTNFVHKPGGTTRDGAHIALVFNGPANVSEYRICADPRKIPTGQASAALRLAIAFCYGKLPERAVWARARGAQAGNSAALSRLVRSATVELSQSKRGGTADSDASDDR
jgi:hypothetical protein